MGSVLWAWPICRALQHREFVTWVVSGRECTMADSPVLMRDLWGGAALRERICNYTEYGPHFLPRTRRALMKFFEEDGSRAL